MFLNLISSNNIYDFFKNDCENIYLAPEIRNNKISENLEKSNIFSIGLLILRAEILYLEKDL